MLFKKIVKKYTGPFKKMLALYKQLFKALHLIDSKEKIGIMTQQLNSIHSDNFLTGNSLIHSVDDILNSYLTTKSPNIIQNTIDKMIDYSKGEKFYNRQRHFISVNSAEGSIEKKLWDKVIMNLHEYREDI
ncbi:MAG: hypothetical protein KDD45_08220 [Bdellovibrionales bacterium]|nr:hypothetical protein [Bdellovibrionales bacterium]